MAKINDRWHKTYPKPGEPACAEHKMIPTAEHGMGGRWQVRWYDGPVQRSTNFAKRAGAEWHLTHLDGTWCLVPDCGTTAVTEPPVLLCEEHRDMLVQQVTRKRPAVHDPLVYFIRNGSRVKIGWTTNLKGRLSSLSLPRDAVELTIPGDGVREKMLHHRFGEARIGRSEWFNLSPEIEDYIARQRREAA